MGIFDDTKAVVELAPFIVVAMIVAVMAGHLAYMMSGD